MGTLIPWGIPYGVRNGAYASNQSQATGQWDSLFSGLATRSDLQAMGFEMSAGWLMAGMIVSTVGMGLFLYGKKQLRMPQLFMGIVMMVYPAFVASPLLILVLCGALSGGLWAAVRAGY